MTFHAEHASDEQVRTCVRACVRARWEWEYGVRMHMGEELAAVMSGMFCESGAGHPICLLLDSAAALVVRTPQVLAIYPTTIRRKVLRHLYLQPVKGCYLFKGCKQRFLDAFLTAARVELFMPGVQVGGWVGSREHYPVFH